MICRLQDFKFPLVPSNIHNYIKNVSTFSSCCDALAL